MQPCLDDESIKAIVTTQLLEALNNPVIREAIKNLFCEMIDEGSLCLNLPEALTVDCPNKKIILSLSAGGQISADISCLVLNAHD